MKGKKRLKKILRRTVWIFAGILLVVLAVPAQMEISRLIRKTGAEIFTAVVIIASALLATSFYWGQFAFGADNFRVIYISSVVTFSLLALFLCQAIRFGNNGVIINCGANLFAIIYLGFLSGFVKLSVTRIINKEIIILF